MKQSSFLKIGIVGKAHGLSGLFFLSKRSFPFNLDVKYVYIETSCSYEKMRVESNFLRNNRTLLKLDKINSRQDLVKYQGLSIFIDKTTVQLEPGEFLWDDVIGSEVSDVQGEYVGKISSINNYGATNIVGIEGNGKLWLIPFTEEFFDMNFTDRTHRLKHVISYYQDYCQTN